MLCFVFFAPCFYPKLSFHALLSCCLQPLVDPSSLHSAGEAVLRRPEILNVFEYDCNRFTAELYYMMRDRIDFFQINSNVQGAVQDTDPEPEGTLKLT